jgi:PAS domain S-box-containing protein
MEQITGRKAEDVVGRTAWDVLDELSPGGNRKPGRSDKLRALTQEALQSGEAPWLGNIMEEEIKRPDGTRRLVERVKFPLKTERGFMLAAVSRDVTDRRQVEDARREAFNIVNMSPAVAILWRNETGWPVEYVTDNVKRIMGYSRDELTSGQIMYSDIVHPGDLERLTQEVTTASQSEETNSFVHEPYRIVTKSGDLRWLDDRTYIRRDQTGRITHFQGVVFDITERRQAEQRLEASLREKETLLQEIHHRVKNNLQVVASLLELQASSLGDEEIYRVFQDSQSRIRTMGLVHERLYRSTDLENIEAADYLQELLDYLFGLYGSVGSPLSHSLKIDDVMLGVDRAIPCGLIVNELVSNAFKHAFPPELERGGLVRVELRVLEDSRLVLIVADNGVGLPSDLNPKNVQTLGLQLVSLLTQQLSGRLEIDSGVGTRFAIYFPARSQTGSNGEPA